MADFIAYLDDSGSPDDGICLGVAGFVSRWDKWISFEEEWRGILNEYGVEYFHMRPPPGGYVLTLYSDK
jgi:hypothetical protein